MKKFTISLFVIFTICQSNLFSKNDVDPIKHSFYKIPVFTLDNPKGKIKIRFIRNEDKSDTTNKSKGFFSKVKNIVNMLLDVSDNPPFKVEIIREKTKKN